MRDIYGLRTGGVFFMLIQAAIMVMEVISDEDTDDDDNDDVLGITPLPRRRYYPRNRLKRARTVPTVTCLHSWDDARFKLASAAELFVIIVAVRFSCPCCYVP